MKLSHRTSLYFFVFLLLSATVSASDYFECIGVVDGHTIIVEMSGKQIMVKLIGIGTPETSYPIKPLDYIGKESLSFLEKMVLGKRVRLEYDSVKKDDSGHLLAYVYLEDARSSMDSKTSVNEEVVRYGYGFVQAKYPSKYLEKFKNLEREAKERAIGLWRLEYNHTFFDFYKLTLDKWTFILSIFNILLVMFGLYTIYFAGKQLRLTKQIQMHSLFLESEKEFYELDKLMLKDSALRNYYKMDDPYLQNASDDMLKQYIFFELYYGHLCRTYVTLYSRHFKLDDKFAKEYWQLYENMLKYLLDDEMFCEVHKWSKDKKLFDQIFIDKVDQVLEIKKNKK
ncbi:MAG: thermonuclease family protein [Proteobacteria bacterium]|nr:thermonuclease family protein [Pseudomonadota bacterium]